MPDNEDPVKAALENLKAFACAGKEVVDGRTADQLTMDQKNLVKGCLDCFYTSSSRLLDPDAAPSFDPPDAGHDYTPIDTSGFDLPRYADTSCKEACDALDEYCEGETDAGARHVRRVHAIVFAYQDALQLPAAVA